MKRTLCFLALNCYLGFCFYLNQAFAQMPGPPIIDTPLTTSKTYFYNGEIIVPYSNGHVSVTNNAAVNILSTTEVTLLPEFTASWDSGCGEFVAGVRPCPIIQIGKEVKNVTCFQGQDGGIKLFASGGIQPYHFNWGSLPCGTSSAATLKAGVYPVVVTDNAGCSTSDTITITAPAELEIRVQTTPSECHHSNGTAKLSPSGGNGSYFFMWQRNGENRDSLHDLQAGVYKVIVKDFLGCSLDVSVSISDSDGPQASYQISRHISCNGQADGSAQIIIPNLNYDPVPYWPCGGIADKLGAGHYPVMVQDSNECTTVVDVEITEPPALTADAIFKMPACGTDTGSILLQANGGTGSLTYAWTTGDSDSLLNDVSSGEYSVLVMDQDSCSLRKTLFLKDNNGPEVISTITNASCYGARNGSIFLNTSDNNIPIIYSWMNDVGINSSAINLGIGNYSVIVSDNNNCKNHLEFNISEPDPILIYAFPGEVDSANYGSLKAIVQGGIPPYSFIWSNGTIGEEIQHVPAGKYNLTVTDASGCSIERNIYIDPYNPGVTSCTDNTPADYMTFALNCSTCIAPAQGVSDLYITTNFGAIPNDGISDEQSFEWANEYIQNNYCPYGLSVTLHIPQGTYIVGRQNPTPNRFLKGHNVLCFDNCVNISIEGEINSDGSPASLIQFEDCLKYGAFDPTPGNTYGYRYIHSPFCCLYNIDPNCVVVPNSNDPNNPLEDCTHNPDPGCGCFTPFGGVNDYGYMASIGTFIIFRASHSVNIKNLDLDGNSDMYKVGGYFATDMAGINIDSYGIIVDGGSDNIIENCYSHHFGMDGLLILKTTTDTDPVNLSVINSKFEWNCRNGASWVGGSGLTAFNCDFNYNGYGPWGGTSPRSGMDAEWESGNSLGSDLCYGQFSNCRYIENRADGFVADKGGTTTDIYEHNFRFYNCTFVSGAYEDANGNYTAGQAARPDARSMQFECCDFHGWINEIYSDESTGVYDNMGPGAKFYRCTFNETYVEPDGTEYSHGPDGGLCTNLGQTYHSLIDISDRRRILWDGCDFNSKMFSKWMTIHFNYISPTPQNPNPYNINGRYEDFNIVRNCKFYKYGSEINPNNLNHNYIADFNGVNIEYMDAYIPNRHQNCNCFNSFFSWCYTVRILNYCAVSDANIIGKPQYPGLDVDHATIPMLFFRGGGSSLCMPNQCNPQEFTNPTGFLGQAGSFPCFDIYNLINSPIIWNIYNSCDPPNCTITVLPSTCPSPNPPLRMQYQESVDSKQVNVSPNPIYKNVRVDGLTLGDKVIIYDLFGHIVKFDIANSNELIFDTSNLTTGVYLIEINFTLVNKLVKL